ncbi:MAG: hypothetical protein NC419_13070 [Muribaculaceae bacterium]|nr:hypothetical protein [Muribaculaceae bacterium]
MVINMEHTFSEIQEKCHDSEMVLIGIGEAFQYNWDILQQDTRFQEIEKDIDEKEAAEYRWVIPFLQKMMLEQRPDEYLLGAYRNLKELVDGCNYFIISTTTDDYVYQCGLKEERIVTPCGGFRQMQCDNNCKGQLMEVDWRMYQKVWSYFRKEEELEMLEEPICEYCGQKKRFNQIGTTKYAEEGYLPQWERYTKWLQGTVNKKLCVIELGVGMQLPSIIRWPFERIVQYNQKSFLYRIHPSLYQLEAKIADRALGIKENPVKFFSK